MFSSQHHNLQVVSPERVSQSTLAVDSLQTGIIIMTYKFAVNPLLYIHTLTHTQNMCSV